MRSAPLSPTAALGVRFGEGGRVALHAYAAVLEQWRGVSMRAQASYAERSLAETHPLGYWTRRGYGFFGSVGVPYELRGDVTRGVPLARTVRVQAQMDLSAWPLYPRLGVRYQGALSTPLEVVRARYVEGEEAFVNAVLLLPEERGHMLGAHALLSLWNGSGSRARFFAAYSRSIGGTEAFRADVRTRPDFRAHVVADAEPVRSLTLGARLAYRSATRWDAYAEAAAASGGRYRARVPAALTLDLSAHKSLAGGRARVGFVFRNLTNTLHRDHPIGASYPLTFALDAALHVGALGRR
jgi:hypothetical protein